MKIFFSHSKHSDVFSSIIKWATKSQWTHCGFILDATLNGEEVVTESAWDRGGGTIDLWESHTHMAYEVFEFESLSVDQANFLRSSLIVRYAYAKIILFGIAAVAGESAMKWCAKMLEKTGIWDNPWTDGMWCSEYIYAYFNTVPGILRIEKDSELITPEDLYQAVKANPKFKLVDSNS